MLDFFNTFHDRPAMQILLENRRAGSASAIGKKQSPGRLILTLICGVSHAECVIMAGV